MTHRVGRLALIAIPFLCHAHVVAAAPERHGLTVPACSGDPLQRMTPVEQLFSDIRLGQCERAARVVAGTTTVRCATEGSGTGIVGSSERWYALDDAGTLYVLADLVTYLRTADSPGPAGEIERGLVWLKVSEGRRARISTNLISGDPAMIDEPCMPLGEVELCARQLEDPLQPCPGEHGSRISEP